jgi:hypothetical protein
MLEGVKSHSTMNILSVKRWLSTLLAIFMFGSALAAQSPILHLKTTKPQTPIYKSRLPGVSVPTMWVWTMEKWSGNNEPYQRARLVIDGIAEANGPNLERLLVKYKEKARKTENPLVIFQWAYVAYQVMLTRNSTITQHQALEGVEEALRQTNSPHTYDYDRIRFLVGEFYTSHREAIPIAKRLLAVNKNDYEVEYNLASTYLNDFAPAKIEDSLDICRYLKQLYPSRSSLYTLTGEAYLLAWHRNHSPVQAKAVVENYQKYLNLAPPKDAFRKRAQQIVNEYEKKV